VDERLREMLVLDPSITSKLGPQELMQYLWKLPEKIKATHQLNVVQMSGEPGG
jgi:hypothetical protein